jgi:hypothetical protein
VDIDTKQARFQVKKGQTCDVEQVKHAIAAAGNYEVTNVTLPDK